MPLEPLDARFVRKLCLLCCHCVRNIAYYRVGFENEDGSGNLKQRTQFGATVNGNMLDTAVLEWCKLFADRNARHHWKRFVRDVDEQRQFAAELLTSVGIDFHKWTRYLDETRVYRDKFVAHLDEPNVMNIPSLEIALQSVFFLYAHVLRASQPEIFESAHLVYLPKDLTAYYCDCRDEGCVAYSEKMSVS